ncbi:MAG: hypothetical protein ACRESO_09705, partial [Gammaproteobacteria bacterium]
MPLWLTVFLLGATLAFVARDGITGLGVQLSAVSCYLLARIIFYMMIETLVAGIFKPRTLMLVRAGFILVLAAGAGVLMGGPILYVVSGWAGLLLPVLGVIFTAGYLVPVVLLVLSYTRAMPAQRPHIRWLLVSSAALLAGIFLSNTLVLDATNNALVQGIFFVLSISGFVYTVLRHRVVDISVVIDRTLVYGSMTALVVGVLAAVNFVAQHAVLSTNASLALQIIVPLSIGIVLTQIRTYMNWLVERIFFRRRYLAEERLRSIARRCAQIERKDRLMETVTTAVRQNLGAIGVALYERRGESYISVRRDSEIAYPDQVEVDD